MYRALLCIALMACGSAPRPALSTVTIRQHRHVVLEGPERDQILACSSSCKDVACLVQQCPGAREQPGACLAHETSATSLCRTFSSLQSNEREGTCKDTVSIPAGTELVSCTDTRAASGGGDGVGSALVIFLIIPVALIVAIATAGPRD